MQGSKIKWKKTQKRKAMVKPNDWNMNTDLYIRS